MDKENLPYQAKFEDVKNKGDAVRLIDREGYTYTRVAVAEKGKHVEYYRCSRKVAFGCKGTARVDISDPDNRMIVGFGVEHCHDSNLLEKRVESIVQEKISQSASFPGVTPKMINTEIVNAVEKEIGPVAVGVLPTVKTINKRIERERKRVIKAPKNPTSYDDLVIPEEYRLLADGSLFMFMDQRMSDGRRIIGLGTHEQLMLLRRSGSLFVDGTFSIVDGTSLFSQLWVIYAMGPTNGKVHPVAFYLCPGKDKEIYLSILKHMKSDLGVPTSRKLFYVDFERAVISATQEVFPEFVIRCCAVHWKRALDANLKKHGLAALINTSVKLQTVRRLVHAISLVPVDHIPKAWWALKTEFVDKLSFEGKDENVSNWISYIEDTYIGNWERDEIGEPKAVKMPRFEHSLWCKHEAVCEGAATTTNVCEGYNSGFRSLVNPNASLWTIWSQIMKQSLCFNWNMRDSAISKAGPSRTKEHERNDKFKQLQRVCNRFNEIANILEFMKYVNVYYNFPVYN